MNEFEKKELHINPIYQDIGTELNLGLLSSNEVIQSLWGGYGELLRLEFENTSIIIKHIKLPKVVEHPYGWNTKLSHERKIHSYKVEVNWYQEFSQVLDERCRIPEGLKCFQTKDEWLIVMEDLAKVGFDSIVNQANENHLYSSLKWLANFHARYINIKNNNIWEVGTYWHLDTRPDELEVLQDKKLKDFASCIDEELKQTKYPTIVHGDAKLANFCFNKQGTSCASVDFQYVGHGCAMKDVAYFISSAVKPEDCLQQEQWLLDTYFTELKVALTHYHPNLDSEDVEREWRPMFCVAWADLQRFLKGWKPNHFKINPYTEALTRKALVYLESKR